MQLQRLAALLLSLSVLSSAAIAQSQKTLPYLDPSLPNQQRVDDLVSRMTLDEKVAQLINTTPAIPRLDVPAYDYWSEGLHGIARSGYATMFPQAIGMAATWDAPLVNQISTVISTEARAKYNEAVRNNVHSIYYGLTIWSPNINIFRDPRWGRGQETYGEDPFLTSRLGVAFVEGLQGDDPTYLKTIATPKHYAVHSGPESTRHSANIDPTPHDLWDTYLPAFRATIVDAKAYSIMCAYNAIDKYPACANKMLLETILRGDWGFKGFVTSDCGAVDDNDSKRPTTPRPTRTPPPSPASKPEPTTNGRISSKELTDAVKKGLITEAQIDVSLKRLFLARYRLGLFDPADKMLWSKVPFSEVGSPEPPEEALAHGYSQESIVLTKNNKTTPLPLSSTIKSENHRGHRSQRRHSLLRHRGQRYNAVSPGTPSLPLDCRAEGFS